MIYPKNPYCPFNNDCMCPGNGNNSGGTGDNNGNGGGNNNGSNGTGNGNNSTGNLSQTEMLKNIMETEFALTDLNLYLDTHPDNKEALEMFTKLASALKSMMYDYSQKYEPLAAADVQNQTPFKWAKTAWPWQA